MKEKIMMVIEGVTGIAIIAITTYALMLFPG